jgi:hypothetical protein
MMAYPAPNAPGLTTLALATLTSAIALVAAGDTFLTGTPSPVRSIIGLPISVIR